MLGVLKGFPNWPKFAWNRRFPFTEDSSLVRRIGSSQFLLLAVSSPRDSKLANACEPRKSLREDVWGKDDVYSVGRMLVYGLGVEKAVGGELPPPDLQPWENWIRFLLEGK